ncbi:major facilitator superfamily domain-containing protein [Hyaloraphidium curvatum]|nr:major facilitator superfamily domain-containing protein [Hyaloraphidium curvatum]
MPAVFFLFLVNTFDRSALSFAAVANRESGNSLLQTLNLTTDQYNWAQSIFLFGYIIFEIPSNIVLKWASPSKWLARICVSWGIVFACMAAITNYGGLLATRFFLGVCEAGLIPGVLYYFTFWYKRSERGRRVAGFFVAGSVATIIGGLLATGIIQMNGIGGLYGWQWLFLLEGLFSILIGIGSWTCLPDYPHTCRGWMTRTERQFMEWRLQGDSVSDPRGRTWVWAQVKDAARNPFTYTFAIAKLFSGAVTSGLVAYYPIILTNLGFTSTKAIAMSAPLGTWGVITLLFWGWSSDRFHDRFFHLVAIVCFPMVAYTVFSVIGPGLPGVKLFLLFLGLTGISPLAPITMAWRTDTIYGTTYTALASSIPIMFGQFGSIIGPQLYRQQDAPLYQQAFAVSAAMCGAVIVMLCITYFIEWRYPQYCGPNGPFHFQKRWKAMHPLQTDRSQDDLLEKGEVAVEGVKEEEEVPESPRVQVPPKALLSP